MGPAWRTISRPGLSGYLGSREEDLSPVWVPTASWLSSRCPARLWPLISGPVVAMEAASWSAYSGPGTVHVPETVTWHPTVMDRQGEGLAGALGLRVGLSESPGGQG